MDDFSGFNFCSFKQTYKARYRNFLTHILYGTHLIFFKF